MLVSGSFFRPAAAADTAERCGSYVFLPAEIRQGTDDFVAFIQPDIIRLIVFPKIHVICSVVLPADGGVLAFLLRILLVQLA